MRSLHGSRPWVRRITFLYHPIAFFHTLLSPAVGFRRACCAACDTNSSCAAWTLRWNFYNTPGECSGYESQCFLFEEIPQPWATASATPPFECASDARSKQPFSPFGCANFTREVGPHAVSGEKPGRAKVIPPPAPAPAPPASRSDLPNILYLVADDMRPQLKSYGHELMLTPHLDRLAATGMQFDFAFTQFAYCAPSRNSFMSGRRPERTRVVNFLTTFRTFPNSPHASPSPDRAEWVAMPQFFKNHGYFTSNGGKLYHDGQDDPASWTFPSKNTAWIQCAPGDRTYDKKALVRGTISRVPMEGNETHFNQATQNAACTVTANSTMPMTNENISLALGLERMELGHASGRPWWVSIGVHRPHAPYRAGEGFAAEDLYAQ